MENDPRDLMPGDRIFVFDNFLYKDDIQTPLSFTMRSATIVRRYGTHRAWRGLRSLARQNLYPGFYDTWKYPDMVDVIFDHRPGISRGHFTSGVKSMSIS